MFKKQTLSTIKKAFFIGFSFFLFGTGSSVVAPKSSANTGFFEIQWDRKPGYKKLKYYQSSSDKIDRATYYFFLRGKERTEDITKLTIKVPDYFGAKIKTKKLSLCKVKVGGYIERTRCLKNIPSLIEVNDNQTAIEIFPEIPIEKDKYTSYAVVMKVFNPRNGGMYQFHALSESQKPGENPISTYLGTWNFSVQ